MTFNLRQKAIVQGMIQEIADGLSEETTNIQDLKDKTAALAEKVETFDVSMDNEIEGG
jgi:uncharacterized coiled-coil protein SlyX